MQSNTKHIKAIVLAAGKGTRLRTEGRDIPKVMRQACKIPLLGHVLRETDFIPPTDTVIVVGYMKEQVISSFPTYLFAEQVQQLGTGHAVMAAMPVLDGYDGDILICYGDMPLIRHETYTALIGAHRSSGNACTLLSGTSDEELAYGRIERSAYGSFLRVVEDRDCTPEQKQIKELNTGLYVFDAKALARSLTELGCNNSQSEYYLTDVPEIMRGKNLKVGICKMELGKQIVGVNTNEDLRLVEAELEQTLKLK